MLLFLRRWWPGASWRGATDPRPLALFRLAFGLTLLGDALDRLRDFHVFYTDDGLLPASLLHRVGASGFLPGLMGSPLVAALVFAVGIIAALAFVVGVQTRWAALVAWLFELTITRRNQFITDGADQVMIVLSFWSMFADLDGAFCLGRAPRRAARAFFARVIEVQIALVYLCAGLAKRGETWRHGEALFHALQLNHLSRPLGMALIQHPAACRALTYATLAIELGYAPLVFSPVGARVTRPLAAALATAFHLGTLAFMRVGMFPFVMIAAQLLLVPARSTDLRAPVPAAASAPPQPSSRAALLTAALAGAQLILVVVSLSPLALPALLADELRWTGLAQHWNMFAPDVYRRDGYFTASGSLADGRTIDPLATAAPGLLPQTAVYSRWFKLREQVTDGNAQALLLRYFCRRIQGLQDVTLAYHERRTRRPGEPAHAFDVSGVARRRCR